MLMDAWADAVALMRRSRFLPSSFKCRQRRRRRDSRGKRDVHVLHSMCGIIARPLEIRRRLDG